MIFYLPKMALHDRIGEAFLVFGEAIRVGVGAAVVIGVGAQVAHCLKPADTGRSELILSV